MQDISVFVLFLWMKMTKIHLTKTVHLLWEVATDWLSVCHICLSHHNTSVFVSGRGLQWNLNWYNWLTGLLTSLVCESRKVNSSSKWLSPRLHIAEKKRAECAWNLDCLLTCKYPPIPPNQVSFSMWGHFTALVNFRYLQVAYLCYCVFDILSLLSCIVLTSLQRKVK